MEQNTKPRKEISMQHKTINANNKPNKLSEALNSYIRGCIKTEFDRNEYGKLFMEYLREHPLYKSERNIEK